MSGQLRSPLLSPSFLPWHSPSHPPHPGFSCPVATTEASQVSPGEEPFALLCSAPHPEPLERGEVGLDGPSGLQLWPHAAPLLQPGAFGCCRLSVFSHLVLLIL